MPGSTGSARALSGELERRNERFRPHTLHQRTHTPSERGRNEPVRLRRHRCGGRRVSAGSGGRSRDGGHADREEAAEKHETEPARHARCGLGAGRRRSLARRRAWAPAGPRSARRRASARCQERAAAVSAGSRLPPPTRRVRSLPPAREARQPQSPRRLPGKLFLRRRPAWRVSPRGSPRSRRPPRPAYPPTAPSGPRPRSSSPRAGRRSRPPWWRLPRRGAPRSRRRRSRAELWSARRPGRPGPPSPRLW